MKCGDVIHFGNDNYRNNNKLIFNGVELEELYTLIDDYGSVPPTFEAGKEFDIGDFEDIIEHNKINWLSKESLSKIELYEETDNIIGKVKIKNKDWFITFTNYTKKKYDLESLLDYINKLIINYDNIKKRQPFERIDTNLLEVILFN